MDSVASHKSFADKYSLTVKLLSDEKGDVVKLYDVKSWLPKRSARAVVIIDRDGIIRYRKVESLSLFRPSDDEIINAIKDIATA
jgi:peroxiredoxin